MWVALAYEHISETEAKNTDIKHVPKIVNISTFVCNKSLTEEKIKPHERSILEIMCITVSSFGPCLLLLL